MTEELVKKANAAVGAAKLMSPTLKCDWTKLEVVGIRVIPETKADGSAMPEYIAGEASIEVKTSQNGTLAVLAKVLRGAADSVSKEPLLVKSAKSWVLNPVYKSWRFNGYTVDCKG